MLCQVSFNFDGCEDMRVRKVSKFKKVEVPGTVQYGRILHGSSMEQYCYARLGYRITTLSPPHHIGLT